MLKPEVQKEVMRLFNEENMSIRKIAMSLHVHRKTVRKYLGKIVTKKEVGDGLLPQSKGRWSDMLIEAERRVRLKQKRSAKIREIFDEVRTNPKTYYKYGLGEGQSISLSTVYAAWRHLKKQEESKRSATN